MNKNYAFDSSAVLAIFYEESGAEIAQSLLHEALISSVNLSEAISILALDGIPANNAREVLLDMIPHVVVFDIDLASLTAGMRPQTQAFGLSLGDRACLATAMHLQLEAVTADKIWSKLKLPVKIKIIR